MRFHLFERKRGASVPSPCAFARVQRLLVLALLVVAAAAARAEGPGESIEVVGDRPAASANAPAAQGTAIDTAQFGGEVRSVSELLLAAPGVTVHPLGGPGQAATLSLRGATADESLVLLDGIPLQGPGGGAIDLTTLPATLFSRLIVTRGVLGAQLGAGALGGAVELLPQTAADRLSGGAQISGGSFGTAQFAADGTMPFGNGGSALVALQGDRTSGDFTFARQLTPDLAGSPYTGFTRENGDATRGSGLARVAAPLGDALELDAIALLTAGDRGLPGAWTNPTLLSRELDEGSLAGLRLRGEAQGAQWSVRAWGRLDRLELRGTQAFGSCQDGTPNCPREDQRSTGGRGQAEVALPVGDRQWVHATLEGGAEWAHGTSTGAHERSVGSLALADDLQITEQLAVHPALRLERVGADGGLSPALTAAFKPNPKGPLELRAGFGLSFRPPTFSELYLDQSGVVSNADLRPERAWSLDAGASWRRKSLLLSAGVFYSHYRDIIIYELFPEAKAKPVNVGEARIAGLELEASLALPASFFVEIAYSFLSAVNDTQGSTQGQPLAYRPPHHLFLRLARRGDRLEGYSELSFVSMMSRNDFGTAFEAAQLVLNAGVGARVAGPIWLDVEAKNLLNDQTLEDLFQYPLPGLSIAVIARARL
jgi:vitamin B12 transporter